MCERSLEKRANERDTRREKKKGTPQLLHVWTHRTRKEHKIGNTNRTHIHATNTSPIVHICTPSLCIFGERHKDTERKRAREKIKKVIKKGGVDARTDLASAHDAVCYHHRSSKDDKRDNAVKCSSSRFK